MHEAVMMWDGQPVRGMESLWAALLPVSSHSSSLPGKAGDLDHHCCVLSVGFPLGFHPGVRSEGSGVGEQAPQ